MDNKNICILTFPISKSGIVPLSNLVDILYPLSSNLYLITGNEGYTFFEDYTKIHVHGINHQSGKNSIERIGKYLVTQIKMSYTILKLWNKIDIYILFIGSEGLIFPILAIKLLCKKAVLAPADYTVKFNTDFFSRCLLKIIKINWLLCNKIVLHSSILITQWDLGCYAYKINIGHEYFLDFNKFKLIKNFDSRINVIGYIGRLNKEKGILNFVESIPKILCQMNNLKFFIAGDGPLLGEIENYLILHNLKNKVQLLGWIPHDKLPDHLNELKLLVIPSYTESGPIIALESMACGTPIVATKVGHILNMIKDEENGFIMDNNSPECISKNILRALTSPNINKIILNAQNFVKNEFTYDVAIEKYKKIIEDL
ncbi:MAG: glycosyltransferase family 4 protein [Methanosarcina flavescens]